MPKKIEISHRTIIFTVFFLALIGFLYYIRDVIFQVFVALLIMSILNPMVSRLQKYGVPRVISVIIVYFLVIGMLTTAIGLMVPPLVAQTTGFATNLPKYLDELKIPIFISETLAREITSLIGTLPGYLLKISLSLFSNVFSLLAVMIFALYFLLAREKLDEQLSVLFSNPDVEKKIARIINKLENKLGGWARAELILMLLIGVSTYVGLLMIGVPYALPLAIIAGFLEIIPNIGPTVAAVPAILVGLSVSTVTAVAATALYILVQQIENYLFVPKIMEKSAGVSPIVTLLSLVIGFKVAGIAGAILSVPIVITSQVLLNELVFNKRK